MMRRGAALLLAIGALAAITVVGAAAMRAAVTARLNDIAANDAAEAEGLVDGCVPALLAWLETGDIDSQPDFADIFAAEHGGISVSVRAVDLSGRLRLDHHASFAAMGLPPVLRAADLEALADRPPATPGLVEEVAFVVGCDALPHGGVAAASWLTAYGGGALNVRTAPIPLLEASLQGADPSSARRILNARRSGEPVEPGDIASVRRRATRDANRVVALTSSSSAAAFLITVEHGAAARRWWLVAERGDPRQLDDADRRDTSSWRWVARRRIAT